MFQAAVLTISDKGSQGLREDKAGPKVAEFLKEHGYEVVYTKILPDEQTMIEEEFKALGCEVAVTTGTAGIRAGRCQI